MKLFDWNDEKNEKLKTERGVSFEEIVFHMTHDGLMDTIQHPNQKIYPGQRAGAGPTGPVATRNPEEQKKSARSPCLRHGFIVL